VGLQTQMVAEAHTQIAGKVAGALKDNFVIQKQESVVL
jgi:hypothetical protein